MPFYRVRVRGKTYLWGGGQVQKELGGEVVPIYLTVRNDDSGETVSLATERRTQGDDISESKIGKIERGQSYSLHLNGVTGVYALQERGRSTTITCEIHGR